MVYKRFSIFYVKFLWKKRSIDYIKEKSHTTLKPIEERSSVEACVRFLLRELLVQAGIVFSCFLRGVGEEGCNIPTVCIMRAVHRVQTSSLHTWENNEDDLVWSTMGQVKIYALPRLGWGKFVWKSLPIFFFSKSRPTLFFSKSPFFS